MARSYVRLLLRVGHPARALVAGAARGISARVRLLLTVALLSAACDSDGMGPDLRPPGPVEFPILAADGGHVFAMADTGGVGYTLTSGGGVEAVVALWSPRGTHVAVLGRDTARARQLFVIDGDGEGLLRVSTSSAPVSGWMSWSPDGASLAYRDDDFELYVVARDGREHRRITQGARTGTAPHWSPDGSWIVYMGDDDAGLQGLVRVRPDGTERQLLHSMAWVSDHSPRFSPDGSVIVFSRDEDLYRIDSDGTGLVQLTATADAREALPRWAPDGRRIAFSTEVEGASAVGVIDPGSGAVVTTFTQVLGVRALSWAPDGERVAVESGGQVLIGRVGAGTLSAPVGPGRFPTWHPGR